MRSATSDYLILKDNDVFFGISLGYDYCAEHEWGIKGIYQKMGIDKSSKELGIKNRMITDNTSVNFLKDSKHAILSTRTPWNKKENFTIKDLLPQDLDYAYKNSELGTAWDENDFCVVVSGEENIKLLEDLYEQFKKNNIAIARLNGSLPAFSNASLSLLIFDRLPKEAVDSMYQVDKKQKDLVEYEAKIGLTKLKEDTRSGYKKEKYYMACSPKWINYEDAESLKAIKLKKGTEYDIQYWVNYSDDDDNYGWYTVEEIKKWLSTPGLKLMQIRDGKK